MNEEKKLIPPCKVGDILEQQEVISLGKKGEGVIKYNNYIIFVSGADKGSVIDVKIEKILPNFGIGSIVVEEE